MNGLRRWMVFVAACILLLCHGVIGETSPAPSDAPSSNDVSTTAVLVPPVGTSVSPTVPETRDPVVTTVPVGTRPDTSDLQNTSAAEPTSTTNTTMEGAVSTQATETSMDVINRHADKTMIILTEKRNMEHSGPALQEEHRCVDKDAMKDRSVVILTLDSKETTCDQFKALLNEIGPELCDSCKFKIFQEDNIVIAGGQHVEADPKGMAEKFSSENVKNKLRVVEAKPLSGKTPPTVLVSLLLVGLLLAALLLTGYCLKDRWIGRAKGKRLAEDPGQTHEDNECQSVSVTPLNPSEAQEKPTVNGESPEGGKNQPTPATTNGHSAAKSAVADTEL